MAATGLPVFVFDDAFAERLCQTPCDASRFDRTFHRNAPAIEIMKRVFFIVGPTAVGKSELAAEIAQRLDAEIVSADAFQIYRGLDLLTAKPDRRPWRRRRII